MYEPPKINTKLQKKKKLGMQAQAFFFFLQFGVSPPFPFPAESSTRIIGLKK